MSSISAFLDSSYIVLFYKIIDKDFKGARRNFMPKLIFPSFTYVTVITSKSCICRTIR
jgi:hypothetical protein